MHINYPSLKTLLIAWLTLMALSIGTMFTGKVTNASALGPLFVLGLFAITWFKATWILRYFLNLRIAPTGWNAGFMVYLFTLLGLIYCIYLFTWFH